MSRNGGHFFNLRVSGATVHPVFIHRLRTRGLDFEATG